jgi:hypothetical protein
VVRLGHVQLLADGRGRQADQIAHAAVHIHQRGGGGAGWGGVIRHMARQAAEAAARTCHHTLLFFQMAVGRQRSQGVDAVFGGQLAYCGQAAARRPFATVQPRLQLAGDMQVERSVGHRCSI